MTSIQQLSKNFVDTKTTTTTITSFSIDGIYSLPYKNSATVYVTLYTTSTDNKKITKNITITGQDYIDWVSDDYLYLYISDRIESLYHQE